VFIAGLEDGLFPLARAFDDSDGLEEERRLFYVGITRARQKLYLLHARTRRRAGEVLPCVPSSFLQPIPDALVETRVTRSLALAREQGSLRWGRSDSRAGGFGRGPARRVAADSGGGLVVDYEDAQDAPRFVKGERVRHPQFGGGTIRELSGFGQDVKAVIDFDGSGRKKVVVRYANLQKEL
jgi:DNA helicase II / ATP-dependent DNA helicase PcrA